MDERLTADERKLKTHLESRLVTATELLRRFIRDDSAPQGLIDDAEAFLAAQPAAPATGCANCGANTFEPHRADCTQPAAPADDEKNAYDRAPSLLGSGNGQPAAPRNPHVCEPDCESPRCPAKLWEQKRAQPAAPARTEGDFKLDAQGYQVPTEARLARARTETEQAVLDAMGALTEGWLRWQVANAIEAGVVIACRAELARRGLK